MFQIIFAKVLPPKSNTANFLPGFDISSISCVVPLKSPGEIDKQCTAATSGSKASCKFSCFIPA